MVGSQVRGEACAALDWVPCPGPDPHLHTRAGQVLFSAPSPAVTPAPALLSLPPPTLLPTCSSSHERFVSPGHGLGGLS